MPLQSSLGSAQISLPSACSTRFDEEWAEANRNWYAVYTRPRHEKRVDQHCRVRHIDSFCPVYKSTRRWRDGSEVTLDLPLFPGYLFVRIPRSARVSVLTLPGVLAIVSNSDRQMAAVSDQEISRLKRGLSAYTAEPHAGVVKSGQRVRIRSGPFAGMTGIAIRVKGFERVVLRIEVIMKSIAVDVAREDLEPLLAV